MKVNKDRTSSKNNSLFTISFKVTEEFRRILEEKVKEAGMDKSEYIRCALENNPVIVLSNSAEIAREFTKFNQLLAAANINNNTEFCEISQGVRNICLLLDSLLTKINNH